MMNTTPRRVKEIRALLRKIAGHNDLPTHMISELSRRLDEWEKMGEVPPEERDARPFDI